MQDSTRNVVAGVAGVTDAAGPAPAGGGPRRYTVGLTGGIGCGKSTVADLFAGLGASIVDADVIAHALTAPGGAAIPQLVAAFGPGCLDASGAMDRARMRTLVFGDAGARATLEAILHPRIRSATLAAASSATGPYVMLVVPLLVESGQWRQRVQRLLVIDCPETLQIARVMARNGMPQQQVEAIMASQASRPVRRAAADDIVVNDAGRDTLVPQITALHAKYLELAERMP